MKLLNPNICQHATYGYSPFHEGDEQHVVKTETYLDISIGAFMCTQCGRVGYYTGHWKAYYGHNIPCSGSEGISRDIEGAKEKALEKLKPTFEVVAYLGDSIKTEDVPRTLGFPEDCVSNVSRYKGYVRFKIHEEEFLRRLGPIDGKEEFGPYVAFLRKLNEFKGNSAYWIAMIRKNAVFGISADNDISDINSLVTHSVGWEFDKTNRPFVIVTS